MFFYGFTRVLNDFNAALVVFPYFYFDVKKPHKKNFTLIKIIITANNANISTVSELF